MGARQFGTPCILPLLAALLAVGPPTASKLQGVDRALAISVVVRVEGLYGAGVLLDPARGLVLTASHILAGTQGPVTVELFGGGEARADRGPADADLDIQVLYIPVRRGPVPEVGSIVSLSEGAPLAVAGCPAGHAFTGGAGVATRVGRSVMGSLYLQTDLPISQGDSGGPVVDGEGRLVALVAFLLRGSDRVNFALPIDYAVERFPSLFPQVRDRRGYLARFSNWREARAPGSVAGVRRSSVLGLPCVLGLPSVTAAVGATARIGL